MARCGGRLVRVSAVASVGALFAVTSCRDFLGFQDAVVVQCILDSDCPGTLVCNGTGVCTKQCATDKDCQLDGRYPQGSICTGGICSLPQAVPPVGVADANAEASEAGSSVGVVAVGADASDALPDQPFDQDAQSESASDASEGGACVPACSQFSLCQAAACLSVTDVGWASPTGGMQIANNGVLSAIQVPVDVCGFVTGLGFYLAVASDETYRFGLYTDNGGYPDQLITQTQSTPIQQGNNEAPVSPVVQIGCDQAITYYWIVGTWNQTAVEFVTENTPVTKWISVPVNDDSSSVLTNGMPSLFPSGGFQLMHSQPHVYLAVAHP